MLFHHSDKMQQDYFRLASTIGEIVDKELKSWYSQLPNELQDTVHDTVEAKVGTQKLRPTIFHIYCATLANQDPYGEDIPAGMDKNTYEKTMTGIELLNISHYRLNHAQDGKAGVETKEDVETAMLGAQVAANGASQYLLETGEDVTKKGSELHQRVLRSFTAELRKGSNMKLDNPAMIENDKKFNEAYHKICAGHGVGGFFSGIADIASEIVRKEGKKKVSDQAEQNLQYIGEKYGHLTEGINALADFLLPRYIDSDEKRPVGIEKTKDDQFADIMNKTANIATRNFVKGVYEYGAETEVEYVEDLIENPQTYFDVSKVLPLFYDYGGYDDVAEAIDSQTKVIQEDIQNLEREGVTDSAIKGLLHSTRIGQQNKYFVGHQNQKEVYSGKTPITHPRDDYTARIETL